jgi:repressor LexA
MPDIVKPLPARQRDVINLIVSLTDEHGYPPTLAELATALGLKNRMTVHQHVAALKKKGLVHWEPGLNRSLRVLSEGLKQVQHGDEVDDESHASIAGFAEADGRFGVRALTGGDSTRNSSVVDMAAARVPRGIPMAGAIAAGSPIDAIEGTDYLAVESQYASNCFALKVKGESMIEDGIYDGDFVIVKPNPSPLNGDVVVALLDDGSATLKRFFKEKGGYRLQPANSEMQPIFVGADHEVTIQGTVVALFRKM